MQQAGRQADEAVHPAPGLCVPLLLLTHRAALLGPVLLACLQVGRFTSAEPLNTSFFRESWDVLKDRLKDVPKVGRGGGR